MSYFQNEHYQSRAELNQRLTKRKARFFIVKSQLGPRGRDFMAHNK